LAVLLLLLAFGGSVGASRSTFDRPLDLNTGWTTAHALIFLRAYQDWGFARLGGVTVSIPKSKEIQETAIARFPMDAPYVYVSYPPLAMWAPYFVFRVIRAVAQVPLSVAFIETYNLIVNRLGGALAVFLLGGWIVRQLKEDRFFSIAGGLTLAVIWMFQPLVLYISQDVYSEDVAVLVPTYLMIWLILREVERRGPRPKGEAGAFLAVATWALGTDWYAWVVGFAGIFILCLRRFQASRRAPLSTLWPLPAAFLVVGAIYSFQLVSFGNRFGVLWDRFLYRTGDNPEALGRAATLFELFEKIVRPWRSFSLPTSFLTSSLGPTLLALSCVGWATMPFALGWWKRPRARPALLAGWVLIVLCPLIQLVILKQHSYTHFWSAYKIGILASLGWLVVPLLASSLAHRLRQRLATEGAFLATSLAVTACIVVTSTASHARLIPPPNPDFQTLAEDLKPLITPEQILVSKDLGAFASYPTVKLWYLDRFVYPPEELAEFQRLGVVDTKNREAVTLSFDEPNSRIASSSACPSRSEWLPRPFFGKRIRVTFASRDSSGACSQR
jgi:hypothetical protein